MSARKKIKVPSDDKWNDKELLKLVAGIQKYGFKDYENLSKIIDTKSPNSVQTYLERLTLRMRLTKYVKQNRVVRNMRKFRDITEDDDIEHWPNIRKWLLLTYNQMFEKIRCHDFGYYLMKDLCQKFYDEAPSCPNPQVLDVKAIYRYMTQCLSMQVPSELPPLESTFVLVMIRKMRDIVAGMDFKDELNYLAKFVKPISFVPREIKSEFKTKSESERVLEDICGRPYKLDSDSVEVPEDMFQGLIRHRMIFQSFNPLTVHLWLLAKNQRYLGQFTANK